MKFISFLLGLIGIAALVFAYNLHKGNIPDQFLPWTPISAEEEPGPFTGYKINMIENNFSACQETLDQMEIEYSALENRTEANCTLENQINLEQSEYPYSAPVQGKCALIVALIIWEKQVLQPLAQQYFESDISRITHYGMFSCRNVRGSSRRSQHASANAIDIAAFRLKNGEQVFVLENWDDGTEKGDFLRSVRSRSCNLFNTVLGPDYNKAHANHFHFDMGPYSICR